MVQDKGTMLLWRAILLPYDYGTIYRQSRELLSLFVPRQSRAFNLNKVTGSRFFTLYTQQAFEPNANIGRVISDVKTNGVVVIPAGSIAKGQIIESQKSGIFGQPGELRVAIKSVTAIDGTIIPLMASEFNDEGKDKLVVSIIGGLLCLFPFFMKGGKAEMPAGTQIQASVLSSTEITID